MALNDSRTIRFDTESRHTLSAGLVLLAASVVAAALYWPALGGPLLLDDFPQLQPLVDADQTDVGAYVRAYVTSTSGPLGRPVAMASFIADALAHGADFRWWKAGNLALHLVSGLLVAWFGALVLRARFRGSAALAWWLASAAAAIWMLHPLQVSTVLYTVQRMTELSTLFVLVGLILYLKGRFRLDHSRTSGWLLIGAAYVIAWPLATLSKESGLLFPVYCTLLELTVLRNPSEVARHRLLRQMHLGWLAAYAAAGIVVLLNVDELVTATYAARDFTLGERLLTQPRVLVAYLGQIFVPVQSRMGFFHDDVLVSTGLLSPATTLPCLLLVVALIASAAAAARRLPVVSFGVLFFFASHLLESSVFGLELMFEHRNYLGLAGLAIAVFGLLADLRVRPARIAAGTAVLCLLLVFVTWNRTSTWENTFSLYTFAYTAHPGSDRVNLYHANAQASQGQYPAAREFLARISAPAGRDLHGLLLDCLEHGMLDADGVDSAARTPGVIDGHATSSANLLVGNLAAGRCTGDLARVEQLLDRVLAGVARSPRDRRTMLMTKAWLQEQRGNVDASVESLAQAQSLSMLDALPTYDAAATLLRFGRIEASQEAMLAAVDIERAAQVAYPNVAVRLVREIGAVLEAAGDTSAALAWYEQASRALPDQPMIAAQSLRLLVDLDREREARRKLADLCGYAAPMRLPVEHLLRAAERQLGATCGDGEAQ